MKIRACFFLVVFAFISLTGFAQSHTADTVIHLPGSIVYGTHATLSGSEKKLLFATNPVVMDGTVSEAFKSIPSLVTDIEGGVTYRGSNQTGMLLNGVPYGLFEEYNGDFLIQLPAHFFHHVAVSSFPPIDWTTEGEAGVVDLRSQIWQNYNSPLVIDLAAGWKERYNIGVLVNQHAGKFHLTAKYNYRKELRERTFRKVTTNANGTTEMNNNASARPDIHLADLNVGYDLSPNDYLSVYGLYYHMDYDRYGRINNRKSAPDGTVQNHIFRHRNNTQKQQAAAVETRWKHTFDESPENLLEVVFNYNNFGYDEGNNYQNERVEDERIIAEDNLFIEHTKHNYYFSAFYQKRFDRSVFLKSGYTGRFREEEYRANGQKKEGESWVDTPANSTFFDFSRQTHQVFASLEKSWRRLAIEGGVQLEYLHQQFLERKRDHVHLYPRAKVDYWLTHNRRFSFQYLQRSFRPVGSWLSEFTDQSDATHITQGNPDLKDELIHSFELSFDYTTRNLHLVPAVYYRNRNNRIMEVVYEAGQQTVWKKENIGSSRALGGELAGYWQPVSFWGWQLSGNVYRNEIDGRIAGYGEKKSLVCGDLKSSFRFFPLRDMEIRVDGFYISDQLTPQGKIKSHYAVNAGISHYFMAQKLRANLSIQNIFDTLEEVTIIDTESLQLRQERNRDPRMVWLSLSYAL